MLLGAVWQPISRTGAIHMAFVHMFTERSRALFSLVATGMATGGVALAGLGVTLRITAADMEGMPVISGALLATGAVVAIAGGIGAIGARGAGYPVERVGVSCGAPAHDP